MRKIFIFLLLISNLFAVKDKLIKPNFDNELLKRGYKIVNYPELLSSKIGEDDKNVFLYYGHFRVIYGLAFKDDTTITNLATNILSIANRVWNKEVEELGFKPPINSDKYYIDIYIGNTQAFNKAENSYVTVSNLYAGYATAYSNKTPYFVINPDLELDILKVAIAHEFFHTIQYAYGLGEVTNEIWNKNIWFLEATATMMEDEVFNDVNDYIQYIDYYAKNTNLSIEYHNLEVEYGKVVFAKYLKEKYGIDFIKSLFEKYRLNETMLETIKKEFLNIDISFKSAMLEFAMWMANEKEYFKEGDLYPPVHRYSLNDNKKIENYGFILFNDGSIRYLISSNPEYLQSNFYGQQNLIDNINLNGLIFLNPKPTTIYTNIAKMNSFNDITLKKGWNLISNILNENLILDTLFSDGETVWVYRDGKYLGYSANPDIKKVIENYNLTIPNNIIKPGEGFWVYTKNEKVLNFDKSDLLGFNLNLKTKLKLLSIASSAFNVNKIDELVTIWHFNKDTKNWEFFTNQKDKDLPYKKIDKILPGNGYFVISN